MFCNATIDSVIVNLTRFGDRFTVDGVAHSSFMSSFVQHDVFFCSAQCPFLPMLLLTLHIVICIADDLLLATVASRHSCSSRSARLTLRGSGYSEGSIPFCSLQGDSMIDWQPSVDQAVADAKASQKFVLLDFFAPT